MSVICYHQQHAMVELKHDILDCKTLTTGNAMNDETKRPSRYTCT